MNRGKAPLYTEKRMQHTQKKPRKVTIARQTSPLMSHFGFQGAQMTLNMQSKLSN